MKRGMSSALLIVTAALIWGTSFPAMKLTLAGASDEVSFSFVISFVRLLISAVLGLVAMLLLHRLKLRIFKEPVIWLLGAFNATSFALQHLGVAFTTASKTALLINFNVVFVAVLSVLFFHEVLRERRVLGVVLGFGGVSVVATRLDPTFLAKGELTGDILVFMAGFFWSLYILYTKKAVDRGMNFIDMSVAVLAVTAIFLLIPLPFINTSQPITPVGWEGIVYLGLVPTLLPLVLWTRALKDLSATAASVILLLEVVFAVLLSIFIIGEAFHIVYILGGAMILAGGIMATSTETGGPNHPDESSM